MTKVKMLANWKSYSAGEIVEIPDETAEVLLRLEIAERIKQLQSPPKDKMVKTPKRKK